MEKKSFQRKDKAEIRQRMISYEKISSTQNSSLFKHPQPSIFQNQVNQ
jgi:hypothetical protein